MNAIILLNGTDVSDSCRLQETRINYDSSRRITTASITLMGHTLGRIARYDEAHFDRDYYGAEIGDLFLCTILDGRDGVTKLFEGRIFSMGMTQSDVAAFEVMYRVELNDHASALDRSVCWGGYTLTFPLSDRQIIAQLLGRFCPAITVSPGDVSEVIPTIQYYDWRNKTCRQVLDDMSGLAGAEWVVDFDARLHYRLASEAPVAPFALSTSPDFVSSFPVKVSSFKRDFSNPINKCFVRGAALDPITGLWVEGEYADPISIDKYGELQSTVIDDQIATGWDAAMRAKSVVLKYANPIESGSFTIWARDGLKLGQQVEITEDALGIKGWHVIRSLSMSWVSKDEVQYDANFGASQPDLEMLLRQLDQRTRWKTTNLPPSTPASGSITDGMIQVPPGLSASSIGSIYAGSIIGAIESGQINTITAGQITGVIEADHIGGVYSQRIDGAIVAGQIGGVYANVINGVIIGDQLADKIIDDLAKYADALRPVPIIDRPEDLPAMPNANFPPKTFFYYAPNGHFYQITDDGLSWILNDNPKNSVMSFYQIGRISADSITGLILSAQIKEILAGQITGAITAGQIGSVYASAIAGKVDAAHIDTIDATQITGKIEADHINTISATQITGYIQGANIQNIVASTINVGLIGDGQIATISGGKIIAGTVTTAKLDTVGIEVGGGAGKPGVIKVYDGTAPTPKLIGEIGLMTGGGYGGWFKVIGAGGTGYSTAKMYTDTAGSLFIRDADLSITSSAGYGDIKTSPATFEAIGGVYNSIALKITTTTAPQSISLISRGIVFYESGSKIGSLVRSPNGGYLEAEFSSGTGYILISPSGGIRSDQGYSVGGTKVIDSTGKYIGTIGGTFTGTVTGTVNTTGTVYAAGGFSGGNFTGSGVLVAGGCGASGFNPKVDGQQFNGMNWDIHFRDGTGRPVNVWVKDGTDPATDRGQVILRIRGGVLVALT